MKGPIMTQRHLRLGRGQPWAAAWVHDLFWTLQNKARVTEKVRYQEGHSLQLPQKPKLRVTHLPAEGNLEKSDQ